MIRYDDGTVFNVGTEAVVNAVNCVGVMGTGLALEFRLRFPEMFIEYERRVEDSSLALGKLHYYQDSSGITIVNFPTKNHFRAPSRLEWIERGLQNFVETYDKWGFTSIAFPSLGTGYGGLRWQDVQPLMECYLRDLNLDVVICLDNFPYADGIEKEMVEWLNSVELTTLSSHVRLSKLQSKALAENRPYKRFRAIHKTKGIGAKTYEAIFTHVYEEVTTESDKVGQLKLF